MNRPAAIVTGGNRGVGEGICNALASKGYNIFMAHCGEGDKAIRVAQRLQDNYGVRVETFAVSYTHLDVYKRQGTRRRPSWYGAHAARCMMWRSICGRTARPTSNG